MVLVVVVVSGCGGIGGGSGGARSGLGPIFTGMCCLARITCCCCTIQVNVSSLKMHQNKYLNVGLNKPDWLSPDDRESKQKRNTF